MKQSLRCCWFFSLVGLFGGLAQAKIHTAAPNLIIILADDMGWGGLSCYDNQFFEIPKI